jgi:hypothetical protein
MKQMTILVQEETMLEKNASLAFSLLIQIICGVSLV